jgi:hypothetical protein
VHQVHFRQPLGARRAVGDNEAFLGVPDRRGRPVDDAFADIDECLSGAEQPV